MPIDPVIYDFEQAEGPKLYLSAYPQQHFLPFTMITQRAVKHQE